MPFRRPDGRLFVRSPEYEEPSVDLYANVDSDDHGRLTAFAERGFVVNRRESRYLVPTTTIGVVEPEPGIAFETADRVDESRLRELDDELRQDVPGTGGWRWDVAGFRAETYESPRFDPRVYIVAVDEASGAYIGIARIWMGDEQPRLGFIGVKRDQRRRGLARALLSRVFGELVARGVNHVSTEIDEVNVASRALLEGLGARRTGGILELIKRRTG